MKTLTTLMLRALTLVVVNGASKTPLSTVMSQMQYPIKKNHILLPALVKTIFLPALVMNLLPALMKTILVPALVKAEYTSLSPLSQTLMNSSMAVMTKQTV